VFRQGAGELVNRKPTKGFVSKSVDGEGYIEWLEVPGCDAETASALRNEYRELVQRFQRISEKVHTIEAELGEQRKKISSAPGYMDALQRHLKARGVEGLSLRNDIFVDFDSQHSCLTDGPAAILRETDPKWWKAFQIRIEKRVKETSERGRIRLMLRDVRLEKTSRLLAEQLGVNSDDGWIDVLAKPLLKPPALEPSENGKRPKTVEGRLLVFPGSVKWQSYLGRKASGINDDDMRFWLSIVRKEDSSSQLWIQNHSGSYHPCNWNQGYDQRDRKLRIQFPPARAMNELFWCLTHDTNVEFAPLISVSFPITKWQSWLKTAAAGKPEYWKRIVK
jgi:hypothetical protein